jgi:hypothetical protein
MCEVTMPGKTGRKIGRDKKKGEAYRAAGTREKNKARKAAKEAKRQERFAERREQREINGR